MYFAFNTDTEVPMCPSDTIVNTDVDSETATVSFSMRFADNVDNRPNAQCDHTSGSQFALGMTVVSCWVVDSSNNMNNCSFTITVKGN